MSFQDNKMLIMPAVDIKNGKCVQLVQGEPGTEQVIIENPEKVAKKWEDLGAEVVHVIDLDGALESTTNIETIKKVLDEVSVPIQPMGIKNPETISKLSEEYGSERVMISLDSKDNKVVIKGWQEKIDKSATEISKEFQDLGAGSILFTNVDVEGLLGGFYVDPVIDLVNSVDIPVVYSGGVTSLDDLKQLQTTGAKGVVIGSALYKDKINLEDALKYQDIK